MKGTHDVYTIVAIEYREPNYILRLVKIDKIHLQPVALEDGAFVDLKLTLEEFERGNYKISQEIMIDK